MFNYLNKTTFLPALLGLQLCSFNALAEDFRIDDMRFSMAGPSFSEWNNGVATNPTPTGTYPIGTLVEGTYQGTNSTNELVSFNFFTVPVHVYTRATNQGSTNSPAGTILGGPAPTINLTTLTADMSSWFAEWSGTEFNQGNNSNFTACLGNPNSVYLSPIATVTDNLDGTYIINWTSCITGGAFNSQVGFWRLYATCTSCPLTTLAEADILAVSQGGNTTRTVTTGGGNVVITSGFGAAPIGYTFQWTSETDNAITDTDGAQGTFTFDPSGLTPGIYIFSNLYQHVSDRGQGSIAINVVASATGDYNDTDNDGIINDDDNISLGVTQLQSELGNASSHVLQTDAGELVLGQTAFCSGKGARITMSDIETYGNSDCTAGVFTDDSVIKSTGVGGFYDFEVRGLTMGGVANIVIPLTAAIPANATYRKYDTTSGWGIFTEGNGDAWASAASTTTGVCPAPGSSAYTPGLKQGDMCIQLTITDGGANDADNSANGLIKDPGGVAGIQSGTEANLASGCSMTGNTSANDHAEWLLLAGFIGMLGWFSMARRKA